MTPLMDTPLTFDTVSFKIPVKRENLEHLQLKMSKTHYGVSDTEQRVYYLKHRKDFYDQASFEGCPTISFDGSYALVQLSAPKFTIGHSAGHVYHLYAFAESIRRFFWDWYDITFPPCEFWIVSRIDICVNYCLPSHKHVVSMCDSLARLRYRGKLAHRTRGGKLLPYWPGQDRTVKFYAKGLEMQKHDPEVYKLFVGDDFTLLHQLLRYEEELRGEALKGLAGVKHGFEVTVPVLNRAMLETRLLLWLDERMKFFGARNPRGDKDSYLRMVDASKLRTKAPYRQAVADILEHGLDWYRAVTPPATFQRRMQKLRKLGIEPAFLDTQWDQYHNDELNMDNLLSPTRIDQTFDSYLLADNFIDKLPPF